jgi:hypothetical protein
VDAGFISGIAANVASAPQGATVTILPCTVTEGAVRSLSGAEGYQVNTVGTPGQRIATAFSPSARFVSESQSTLQSLFDQIGSRPDRDALFDRAAKMMPQDFTDLYQKELRPPVGPQGAFLAAKNLYLPGAASSGPRYDSLIQVLQTVLK